MKDERKTERNTEWNDEAEADRDFLREKLKNAGIRHCPLPFPLRRCLSEWTPQINRLTLQRKRGA